MKRTSKLLGALLALCLLLSLLSLPAMAEPVTYTSPDLAEYAYREEFAKTGGWPPELVGSWVGYMAGSWGCWSFYRDGRHVLTNFDFPGINMAGTSKTLKPAEELTFETTAEGTLLHLKAGGNTGEFRKVGTPWVRLKAEEETAAAGVDPAILGTFATFATTLNGLYTEWTFHGDGRFTQVTPIQELTEHGTYLAGDGSLVILLNWKIISCSYKAEKSLQLQGLPDTDSLFMQPKTGPLVQIPNQWSVEGLWTEDAAYREEFAATGGWLPETIGFWIGQDFYDLCGQFCFYPDGRYTMTVFESPGLNRMGTSKTLESADRQYVEDGWMYIEDNDVVGTSHRLSMPYARMKFEKETAAAGLDPAVLGTYGGRLDGLYTEWTFHGDGRLTQVTPYEESTVEGTYFTGDGNLAVLVNGKMIRCTYRAIPLNLVLKFTDSTSILSKKNGPMVQVPEQWKIQ